MQLYDGKPLIEAVAESLQRLIERNKYLESENTALREDHAKLWEKAYPEEAKKEREFMLDNEIRLMRQ